MRILFGLIFFFTSVFVASSQTVEWVLPQDNYSEITRISSDLYKVSKGGKIGVFRTGVGIIVPVEFDELTPFYEKTALLISNDNVGERVVGVLTANGVFRRFSMPYYTLTGQRFYSDGLLTVSNSVGKKGFIDTDGNEIVGFDGRYDRIKPFVDGYAAVFRGRQYFLISKSGRPVQFVLPGVGEIYGGTNSYNGMVYVWDSDGKFYVYNTRTGGECRKASKPYSSQTDYLYRFATVSGKSQTVPYDNMMTNMTKGLAPQKSGDLYGFANGDKIVLPVQFDSASQFENDEAVVRVGSKIGILKYVPNESFSVPQKEVSVNFYENESTRCGFTIEVPSVWKSKPLSVVVKSSDGESISVTSSDNKYTFTLNPQYNGKRVYNVSVRGEGLDLYNTTLSYRFNKKYRCKTCHLDVEQCSYKGNHPVATKDNVEKCEVCGKPIKECKFQGVHW